MIEYCCNRCDKKFCHKSDYVRHINRKTLCKNLIFPQNNRVIPQKRVKHIVSVDKNINVVMDKQHIFTCTFCDKSYTRDDNLKRHINTKHNTQNILDKDIQIAILIEQVKSIQKKNGKFRK